nr:unnamed protein product [Callosobruchus chinensis]
MVCLHASLFHKHILEPRSSSRRCVQNVGI